MAVSSEFSRSRIKNTFIDATGLGQIAQNFDDVYQTAYIDLEGGFYKRLTESVVRSNREARQILLKATGKGEVSRTRVVQALRSLSRHFDDALASEVAAKQLNNEPKAVINGIPILPTITPKQTAVANLDDFVLPSRDQIMTNLQGKWRLQLLADKQGDGVTYFNSTKATQQICTESMTFAACGPSGFITVERSGELSLNGAERVLSRHNVQSSGDGGLFGMFAGKDGGFTRAVTLDHQIMAVDSVLLVTKCAPGRKLGSNSEKDYFCVWRRTTSDIP